MTQRPFLIGGFLCALAVAAGAFGAHSLKGSLDAQALDQWHTAFRYLMYAGLGALLAGTRGEQGKLAQVLLAVGGIVFACVVGGLALGGPRILGAVAPLGGIGMIAGFVVLAAQRVR